MAIDSQPALEPARDSSVIENEIPAYRAISARAVTSVVLGLASVFCFTSLSFLLLVLVAVLFGWSALVAIRRYPEVLTGAGLARTGMALALLFGITASTRQLLEWWVLKREAGSFAAMYVDHLKKDSLATAAWYMQSVAYRKDKAPDAVLEEMRQVKTPPNYFDSQTKDILNIKARLQEPNQEIHFARIESQLTDGLTQYANALVDLDGPANAKYPAEEFALLELVKDPNAGRDDWKVRAIRYPYKPASLEVQPEHKDDDGHGHG